MSERFTVRKRLASFRFALAGLRQLLFAEHNARIHAVASIVVVGAGLWLQLDRFEWCWVVLSISLVWFAEATNTAIERLGDAITEKESPQIGVVKDVAAAAVLIVAFAVAMIGLLIFVPHLVTAVT